MEQHFAKLETAIEEEDYDQVIQISERILLSKPDDIEANKCKVVTLMKQDKFSEAVRVIDKIPSDKTRQALLFEKAYSLYSLKKYSEAEALLASVSPKALGENDALLAVKAQLLFRVNKFAECHAAYQTLLKRATDRLAKSRKSRSAKNDDDDDDDDDVTNDVMELNANLCAAYCEAGEADLCARLIATWHFGGGGDDVSDDVSSSSPCSQAFECGFNAACHYAGAGDAASGSAALGAAEALYRDYLSEDEDNDDVSIASSLAGFTAQRGYFDVISGDVSGGLEKYIKAHDDARATSEVKIISANNCAALSTDVSPSASLKKLAAAVHNDVAFARLSARQQTSIALTKAILIARTTSSAPSDRLRNAITDYVNSAKNAYLNEEEREAAAAAGAVLYALATKSTAELEGYLSSKKSTLSPENKSTRGAIFTLAQMHLAAGRPREAAEALCTFAGMDYVTSHRAVAAAVVRMLDVAGSGEEERAAEVLVKCAEAHREDAGFIKVVAEALRRRKKVEQMEYVLGLEKKKQQQQTAKKKEKNAVVVVDPREVEALASDNIAKAEKLAKNLAPIPELPGGVQSVDALEGLPQNNATAVSTVSKVDSTATSQKQKKGGAVTSSDVISGSETAAAAKKKRKRKPRLPKNYNPEKKPDPERWLPKEQRRGFRAKKNKKKGNSAAQQGETSLAKGLPGARDAALEEKLGAHDEEAFSQQAVEKATANLPKAVRQGGGGRKMNKRQNRKK